MRERIQLARERWSGDTVGRSPICKQMNRYDPERPLGATPPFEDAIIRGVSRAINAVLPLDSSRTEEQLAAESARAIHGLPEADLRRWRQRGCVWPSLASRVNTGLEPQVRSEPFRADQVRLFLCDRFTCRYCGRPTIFLPVLQLLAMRYPEVLRLEEAWRVPTNLVFWVYAASPEHRIPFKRGGTADVHNLLTACYDCQDRKSDWLLGELGWPGLDISSHDWKGFANIYEGLYIKLRPVVPTTKRKFFDDWLRAWKEGSSNSEPAA